MGLTREQIIDEATRRTVQKMPRFWKHFKQAYWRGISNCYLKDMIDDWLVSDGIRAEFRRIAPCRRG